MPEPSRLEDSVFDLLLPDGAKAFDVLADAFGADEIVGFRRTLDNVV